MVFRMTDAKKEGLIKTKVSLIICVGLVIVLIFSNIQLRIGNENLQKDKNNLQNQMNSLETENVQLQVSLIDTTNELIAANDRNTETYKQLREWTAARFVAIGFDVTASDVLHLIHIKGYLYNAGNERGGVRLHVVAKYLNGSIAIDQYIPKDGSLNIQAGDTYALDTRLIYGYEMEVPLINTLTITPEWNSSVDSSIIIQGETMDLRINHFEY